MRRDFWIDAGDCSAWEEVVRVEVDFVEDLQIDSCLSSQIEDSDEIRETVEVG